MCVTVLGLQCSMADVSAAGIELPDGVIVAISSTGFFMYHMRGYYLTISFPPPPLAF